MGVIERDDHRRIPCDLNAAVCADGPRILGSAPNPARCEAHSRPGYRRLRIGLICGARFGRVVPGEDYSAANLEGLGRRQSFEPFSRMRGRTSGDGTGLSVWHRTSMFASSGFILWPGGWSASSHGWRRKPVTTLLSPRWRTGKSMPRPWWKSPERHAADARVLNWRVISMAKDSNVIRRVNRILDRRLQVSKPFGRFAWVTLIACSMPVIYLSAAVTLAPVVPGPPCQSCGPASFAGTEIPDEADRASGSESNPPQPRRHRPRARTAHNDVHPHRQ